MKKLTPEEIEKVKDTIGKPLTQEEAIRHLKLYKDWFDSTHGIIEDRCKELKFRIVCNGSNPSYESEKNHLEELIRRSQELEPRYYGFDEVVKPLLRNDELNAIIMSLEREYPYYLHTVDVILSYLYNIRDRKVPKKIMDEYYKVLK